MQMTEKPIVALSCDLDEDLRIRLRQDYVEPFAEAGAVVVIVPPFTSADDLEEWLRAVGASGVVFSGGPDMHPSYFGEEPHPAIGRISLQRDQFAGEGKEGFLHRIEEAARSGEVAAQQRLEHREAHGHQVEVGLVLRRRTGAGPHHVAEVVVRQTRHHRIEVDDAAAGSGKVVDQDVVEFGVVMGGAFGQLSGGLQFEQPPGLIAAGEDELQLRRDLFEPSGPIFLHRQFQCGQPGGRVVEVRNRLVKPAVEVGEVRLKAAERRRRLIGLIGCFEDVVGAGVFDEDVAAEEVARRIPDERLSVARRNYFEGAVTGFRVELPFFPDFPADVAGDPHEILHQRFRIAENIGVDPLENIMHRGAALIKSHLKGVIDMPGSIRNSDQIFSVDGKL